MKDTFIRGLNAHEAQFVTWICDECGHKDESEIRIYKNRCVKCGRWMRWEPVFYAGEIT